MKIKNLKTMHKSELAGLIMLTREEKEEIENAFLAAIQNEKLQLLTDELKRRANKQRGC
tara:strand:- start:263 stop:439 length:177 start_codon:yes stop_codon:yes gene_type:complete